MRTTFTLLALAGAALCQELSSLPQCGQTCITNMISIAQSEFGCQGGDVACYCGKAEFGYGVRDCSNQACSAEDALRTIEYGTNYCRDALSSAVASSGAVPILSSAASATDGAGGASSTPITTSALVGTVTSGDSTYETTTGFSTIYAPVGGASSAVASATESAGSAITSAASSASDAASSAASEASSVASSAASSAESAASSAASEASSIAESATSAVASATNTGNAAAPMRTAFPMAGAVGLAALLLV